MNAGCAMLSALNVLTLASASCSSLILPPSSVFFFLLLFGFHLYLILLFVVVAVILKHIKMPSGFLLLVVVMIRMQQFSHSSERVIGAVSIAFLRIEFTVNPIIKTYIQCLSERLNAAAHKSIIDRRNDEFRCQNSEHRMPKVSILSNKIRPMNSLEVEFVEISL